jgi:hypothetical protein
MNANSLIFQGDQNFWEKLHNAIVAAAGAIVYESDQTPDHADRVAWAVQVSNKDALNTMARDMAGLVAYSVLAQVGDDGIVTQQIVNDAVTTHLERFYPEVTT